MKPSHFNELPTEEQDWLDAYLDGTIEPEAFEALQDRMTESPELRAIMRRYLALDNSLQNESGEVELAVESATGPWLNLDQASKPAEAESVIPFRRFAPIAAAASLAFLLGLAFMWWTSLPDSDGGGGNVAHANPDNEPSARGFAVVARLFDAAWPDGATNHREGDTLGTEVLRLASGMAEIQFFSGATMTVEGPAEISLKSAWEASCLQGAVRMQVPPAARGFKLHAPSSEIVDLGTEFGLVVRNGKAQVEVFDGEIAIRKTGGTTDQLVKKGAALELAPDGSISPRAKGNVVFPDVKQLGFREAAQIKADFTRWKSHRDKLARDDRLISYYTFDRKNGEALIPNVTSPPNPEFNGTVVLAEPVDGRWPEMNSALEFRRPGSRVRVNLPGEFPAFTFVTWVRIDSLDRWYNALFMADSYETGEPHWQIRDDGRMILSVMVDDSRPNPKNPDGPPIRFQRLYFSEPMWDPSMSGQWLHLASVFDPGNRRVSHYVNGERISRHTIEDQHLIDTLRIGNAEIGNWGQPFREDPTFAIRNLNGRMDEIAIFKAALQDEEIVELYEQSRSVRR